MDFMTWLSRWLQRHPLKTPDQDRVRYTAEVMTRVRQVAQPARAGMPSLWRPQWVLAAVAAAGLIVVLRVAGRPSQTAAEPPRALMQLAQDGGADEDSWMDETVQLLDQLEAEGEVPAENNNASEDDWMNELELLEESDTASSS